MHDLVDKAEQAVVITVAVENAHGFVVVTQLPPGPDFKQFFKSADAAGQCQKGIGLFSHEAFAFVHGVHHMQHGAAVVREFFFNQGRGDDAHHRAACSHGGFGHLAHQTAASAAINQLAAMGANPRANLHGKLHKSRVVSRLRAAIHADRKRR